MKPTLLLLPGTLCDARIFRHQCRALRDVADLRALDYAGLDRSGAWLDRLLGELPEQFSIAGFSLGGLWALELLRRAPQRVQRLALIASNARPASGRARRRSASQWRVWQREGPAAVARGAKPAYCHHPSQRQRHGPLVRAMADGRPHLRLWLRGHVSRGLSLACRASAAGGGTPLLRRYPATTTVPR